MGSPVTEHIARQQKLSRREIVQKLLGGMVAGAAMPLIGSSHPMWRHLTDAVMLDRGEELLAVVEWKPLFLEAGQDKTLAAVSEVMVPGSAAAGVDRFVDLLLSVDTGAHQEEFVASLAAMDDEAKKKFGRGFAGLMANEQVALLTNFSTGESQGHFDNLKQWIVGAYYSSEQGMRELGWDGNYAFESFPGCEHEVEGH
jgi:Gluconate 2-dehydrogenase subunit 3